MTEIVEQIDNLELTANEAGRLEELEDVITKVFVGAYVMWEALEEIDIKRLYRLTHNTFPEYCRDRFEISKQRAYQYIAAKKAFDKVNHGRQKILPLNERQIRPLTRLQPDTQAVAWDKVVASAPSDGAITAKLVTEIVDGLIGKEIKKKVDAVKSKTKTDIVSEKFTNALWALVDVVREEAAKPLKAKMRANMRDSIRRVENLLEE